MKRARAATRRYLPGSPFNAPPPAPPAEQFALHDQVSHDRYGLGVVIGVEDGTAVLVDFGPRQERITMPCPKMTKL
jgi:alkanesulfonate monooxygenase SsuD/methylene tetrahydromethanopterin reductase-like flavin-dependent oxidoreductase (luciferase family)